MCNVSLIETACHLCGDVKAVGGTYSENEDSFHATAHLETPDKRCEPFYKWVKTPKCIFIFYLKYELTSKRIIQFILQNSHHKFEEIQGVWREGEIHYISVTRWNGTES